MPFFEHILPILFIFRTIQIQKYEKFRKIGKTQSWENALEIPTANYRMIHETKQL